MLVFKVCVALGIIGVMLFTPFLLSVLTIGIFYAVTVKGIAVAKVEPGFGRVLLMLVGCGVQWLVLSILFTDAEIVKTGLIYLGLILLFGVPLDSLNGVCQAIGQMKQQRDLRVYDKDGPDVLDAEVVDD
jgi:hypothetical protein